MNGLMAWMEKYILPTAAKIGAQKHLVALRDAFIGTLRDNGWISRRND